MPKIQLLIKKKLWA